MVRVGLISKPPTPSTIWRKAARGSTTNRSGSDEFMPSTSRTPSAVRATPPRRYRSARRLGSFSPGTITASSTGILSTWRGPLGLTRTNSRASALAGPLGAAAVSPLPVCSASMPITSTVTDRFGRAARVAGVTSTFSPSERFFRGQTVPSREPPTSIPARARLASNRLRGEGRGREVRRSIQLGPGSGAGRVALADGRTGRERADGRGSRRGGMGVGAEISIHQSLPPAQCPPTPPWPLAR